MKNLFAEISGYAASRKDMVDLALKEHLPSAKKYPALLHHAIRYSVFPGGKRFRAVLVMASYETFRKTPAKILPVACAVELIHTYSLIHDDLPALDNDDTRRGRPSLHRKFNEALAVLAGDALLTMAFSLLSDRSKTSFSPAKVLAVINEIASACGASGMVGGQTVDICRGAGFTLKELEYIHSRKTAALIRSSAMSGALLGGARNSELEKISSYGNYLGLAFQMMDDLKDAGGNKNEPNFAVLIGRTDAEQKTAGYIKKAKNALEGFGKKGDLLKGIADELYKGFGAE